MTIIEIFKEHWPTLLTWLGTIAPIMTVMIPKLLNDKKIIKEQNHIVEAIKKFETIEENVFKAIANLEETGNKLKTNAVIPAQVNESVNAVLTKLNKEIGKFNKQVQTVEDVKTYLINEVSKKVLEVKEVIEDEIKD